MWRRLLIVLLMIGCGDSGPQLNTTEPMTAGDVAPSEGGVGGTGLDGGVSMPSGRCKDDEVLYVPQAPMRDTDRPAWRADAALSFGLGGDGIVVTWPEAIDNVAVTAYSIFLSGSLVARVRKAITGAGTEAQGAAKLFGGGDRKRCGGTGQTAWWVSIRSWTVRHELA